MNARRLLALVLCLIAAGACGELKEQSGDLPDLSAHEGYPYFLVVGGGLSETLSVVRVEEGPTFRVFDDVALTGSAIHQTEARGAAFYALCSLSNSIVVYDTDLNIVREVSVGDGTSPIGFTFVDDRTVWVSNFVAEDVRLVDVGAGVGDEERVRQIAVLPAGADLPHDPGISESWSRPSSLALAHGRLFVALSNLSAKYVPAGPGAVAVLDAATGALETTITLNGRDATGLVYDEQRDLIWVAGTGDYVTGEGFVGNGMLEAIDPASGAIARTIEIAGAPYEILLADDGRAYLGNAQDARVPVVDLDAGEQIATIDLRTDGAELSFTSALALDPDGRLYVADFNSDTLFVLDPERDYELLASLPVNDGPDTLTFLNE